MTTHPDAIRPATRTDVPLPAAGIADVAPTVPAEVERGCCRDYELDRYGWIYVDDLIVGRVKRNRGGKGFIVWVTGERTPHSFPGRSAIFGSEDEAAAARAAEVRRG